MVADERLTEPRVSFSNLPAFLDPNGSITFLIIEIKLILIETS